MSTVATPTLDLRRSVRWRPLRTASFPSAVERRRFGRLVVYGLLWAVVAATIEVPNLPEDGWLGRIDPQFVINLLFMGLGLAVALYWATTGPVNWSRIAFAVVAWSFVTSLAISYGIELFWVGSLRPWSHAWLLGTEQPHGALLAYHGWVSLVYGGSAAILYTLRLRVDQTTRALRAATLARERNEAAIAEARVRALVERIEPGFLLDVMNAARLRYRTDGQRAEAILDGCVVFLRAAMPQIRSGLSNLAAELDLAAAFLALRSLMIDTGLPWRIEREDDYADSMVPDEVDLPPLVLLPILEPLVAAIAAKTVAGPLIVRERRADDVVHVTIEVATAPGPDRARALERLVEPDRLDAIGLRVRGACGPDATLVVDWTEPQRLAYHFRLPASTRCLIARESFPPSAQENAA